MAPKPTLEQSNIVDAFTPGDKNLVVEAGAGCGKTTLLKMAARAVPNRKGMYIAYNKALRNDQPVLTPDGWKVIGDMCVGDLVIGLDGKAHSVTKVHPRGVRPMFEVVFSDGTIVVADEEHLWLTQTITYDARPVSPVKWRIRTTQQIADTVHQKHRVPHLQAAAELNHRHDLPISSYLLGALLGDGSFCHHAVLFSCAEDDLVELVRAELPEGHAINAQQDGGRGRSWLISGGRKGSQGSNKVMAALRDLGLHGHRSGTKFVPPMYLYASAEQRLALLQGLMDTDGCASGVQSFFRTTSKQLADDVVFLAQSLGGVATVGQHENGSYLVNVRLGRVFKVI
ncbi:hypothetical protein E1286_08140 [Nonomuraea terrae]|uniref:DOD-type homing endonuclease domain-containing protein n=1 Tax=Nonomuraea terrae TaxID=2530383 RepID=A0A4R4Z7A8_9ACTN|nr:LAGLIDADG family homing endonuclease [Nonomuraea terrae]TDD53014.1 hypothetical protein E1286_08140 [Nonomuraea terrae]